MGVGVGVGAGTGTGTGTGVGMEKGMKWKGAPDLPEPQTHTHVPHTATVVRVVTVICDSGHRHMSRFWSRDFFETHTHYGVQWPTTHTHTLPACLRAPHSTAE
jgi:hypothetical protein